MLDIPIEFIIMTSTQKAKDSYEFKWKLYTMVNEYDVKEHAFIELSEVGILLNSGDKIVLSTGTLHNMYYEIKRMLGD